MSVSIEKAHPSKKMNRAASKSGGAADSGVPSERAELVGQVIRKRRSTRRFADTPIQGECLDRLITAGVYAPSGSNWQNQRFIVIQDREEIQEIGRQRWVWPYRVAAKDRNPSGIIGNSSALIIVFADAAANDFRGRGEYHIWESLEIQNAAASIQNICLMATAEGIANCWVSASEPMSNTRLLSKKHWREVLSNYDIPNTCKIQGIVCLGHPTSVDEQGFPVGEKKHGATVWSSTEREPNTHYLIKKRTAPESSHISAFNWGRLRLLAFIAKCLKAVLRRVDKSIEKVERRCLKINYKRDEESKTA